MNEEMQYLNRMLTRLVEQNISIEVIYYTLYGDSIDRTSTKVILNDTHLNDDNKAKLIKLL